MNVERLTILAEWLEANAPAQSYVAGFNMTHWSYRTECGTICCIGGATNIFFGKEHLPYPADSSADEYAADLLDLRQSTAEKLFYPSTRIIHKIGPGWAARCIRKLIATGEVDWENTQ